MERYSYEEAVAEACRLAIESLGDNYKNMSCFLYNWQGKGLSDQPTEQAVAEAA